MTQGATRIGGEMTGICVKMLALNEFRPEWAITFGGRGREAPVDERDID